MAELMSLTDAVAALVSDGDSIAFEGFTHLIPFAAARRDGRRRGQRAGDDYDHPRTRLPGAGGAPEIAARCGEVVVIAPDSPRTLVERLDFCTTVGHGDGPGGPRSRQRLGFRGAGPTAVITDLGVLEPDPDTQELVLTRVHAGVTAEQVSKATGWELKIADELATTERPSEHERLTEVTGPALGEGRVGPNDHDLTAQHGGEPIGQRIQIAGRLLDSGGRPIPNALVEIWQANAAGRYRHANDNWPAPLDPNTND